MTHYFQLYFDTWDVKVSRIGLNPSEALYVCVHAHVKKQFDELLHHKIEKTILLADV